MIPKNHFSRGSVNLTFELFEDPFDAFHFVEGPVV